MGISSGIQNIRRLVAGRKHRNAVGGRWDELGKLQFEFLVAQGLKPHHRLIDIGCGSFRGGVHFVRYLEPGHYYGIEARQSVLDAGYEHEISRLNLAARLPRENLLCSPAFELGHFAVEFDFGIAFSLFTHLPLNSIRVCLERAAPTFKISGILFATFFEAPPNDPINHPIKRPETTTFADADPYHYRVSDFSFAAAGLPWRAEYIGNIAHPRGQNMMAFHRI